MSLINKLPPLKRDNTTEVDADSELFFQLIQKL